MSKVEARLDLGIPAISFAYHPGKYPEVGHLLAATPTDAVSAAFDPYLLADFAKAAGYAPDHTPVILSVSSPVEKVSVALGDDFRALLMPMRSHHSGDPSANGWLAEAFPPPVEGGAK